MLSVAEVDRGNWTYWRVPLNGGARQRLLRTGTREEAGNATFATDGTRSCVTLGGNEGDVWTVDVSLRPARE